MNPDVIPTAAWVAGAYMVGSIPTAYWLGKVLGFPDIRAHGSGNIGATNAARVFGTKYFFIVFCIDFLKAFLVITLAQAWLHKVPFVGITFIIIQLMHGNARSVFLERKQGGKGVSTMMGIVAALSPLLAACVVALWLCAGAYFRTSASASIAAAIALPFFGACIVPPYYIPALGFMSGWILWRHQDTIRNLLGWKLGAS